MYRPPRNAKRDRMVSWQLILYAYVIAGLIETTFCFLAFWTVLWREGIGLGDLADTVDERWSGSSDPWTIGGRTLTGVQQEDILREAQSAYFLTIVMSQFWHIWNCKTRRMSVWKHGLFNNFAMNLGTIISICFAVIMVYAPFLHPVLLSHSVRGWAWLPQFGSLLFLTGYNTWRKWYANRHRDSFVARWLIW